MTTVELPDHGAEHGVVRRLRFRQALSRLAQRGQSVDLLKMVLVPGAVLVVAGVALMLFGWTGAAAHTARQIEQIPYLISGGLIGLSLVFLGGLLLASAFWMTVIRRFNEEAEARAAQQLRALEERLAELTATAASNGKPAPGPASRRQHHQALKQHAPPAPPGSTPTVHTRPPDGDARGRVPIPTGARDDAPIPGRAWSAAGRPDWRPTRPRHWRRPRWVPCPRARVRRPAESGKRRRASPCRRRCWPPTPGPAWRPARSGRSRPAAASRATGPRRRRA